jgi:hypothetical protein
MNRRLITGGVSVATALLLSTLTAGTANAATGTITVTQRNSSNQIVCIHNYTAIPTDPTRTIHESPCNSTVTNALVTSTVFPDITVVGGGFFCTCYGIAYFPMTPNGLDITVPGGVL